jgi:hypothetical protein
MESKLFTIEQANKMLPLIRSITANVMETWEEILKRRDEIKDIREQEELKEELNYLIDKVNRYIKEVEELGCFVEEFKRGIINFPSLFNGRRVLLSWYPQDERVGYFHELDETFRDRLAVNDRIFSVKV